MLLNKPFWQMRATAFNGASGCSERKRYYLHHPCNRLRTASQDNVDAESDWVLSVTIEALNDAATELSKLQLLDEPATTMNASHLGAETTDSFE